jgi:hypothetical protein
MRVVFHPDFPKDIKASESQYREVSERLALRFRAEIDEAIAQIKARPSAAGHCVQGDLLVFRSVIPSASDPLTWLRQLGG